MDPYQLRWALAIGILLFIFVRYMLARRASPKRLERQRLIAALCQQHGMLPYPVDLATLVPALVQGGGAVFENSFQSADGGLWVADMWQPSGKKNWERWDAFSMLLFKVAGVEMPSVAVTRKGQMTIVGSMFGSRLELESTEFDERFTITAVDRRDAVMLLDQGMMQWLLDCDQVSFAMRGDTVQALVKRGAESSYQPGLGPGWHRPSQPDAPSTNPRRADPVELELLFKFCDGFRSRVPPLVRTEYAAHTP